MKTSTRQQEAIDKLALLLMKNETYAILCRSRNFADSDDKQAAKLAAERAAKAVLTLLLKREPTPEEIALALWK
jgi:hypothetical protein